MTSPSKVFRGFFWSFAFSAYCRDNGIKIHLDSARLFEILRYYQKSAADVCALREISGTCCCFETNIGDQYACAPQDAFKSAFHMLDQAMKKLTNEGVENK